MRTSLSSSQHLLHSVGEEPGAELDVSETSILKFKEHQVFPYVSSRLTLFFLSLLKTESQTLQQTWGKTHCPYSLFSWTCGRMNVLSVCSWVFSLFSLLVEAWCVALWCDWINIMGLNWSPQDISLREKCENLLFPFSGNKNWGLLKSRFLRWFLRWFLRCAYIIDTCSLAVAEIWPLFTGAE